MERSYHHGDLPRALVDAAAAVVGERGPAHATLREVARRAGVSHAAAAYHFGGKAGLLTELAAEGFRMLRARLGAELAGGGTFLDVGVAYVRFALEMPAHFEVMFRPELYRRDDPDLRAAADAARAVLVENAGVLGGDPRTAAYAAWSLVHGLATLLLDDLVEADLAADPEGLARRVAQYL